MGNKGLHYYTDGINEKMCKDGEQPEGWYRGCSESHKRHNSESHKGYPSWNRGLTKEVNDSLKRVSEKKTKWFQENREKYSETCKLSWKDDTYRKLHTLNAEARLKISQSSKENWKNESYRQKLQKSLNDVFRTKEYHDKRSFLSTELWKSEEYRNKRLETMRINKTFNSSKQEDKLFLKLQEQFGQVIRHYHDERYPFECDFYIPDKDLFIEYNAHWTHGGMLYDSNSDDCIKLLKEWEEKAKTSKYYKLAIHTWTIRDVNKYQTALKNLLNYKVLYKLDEDIV